MRELGGSPQLEGRTKPGCGIFSFDLFSQSPLTNSSKQDKVRGTCFAKNLRRGRFSTTLKPGSENGETSGDKQTAADHRNGAAIIVIENQGDTNGEIHDSL
jgi:hypothetical protein